MARARSAVRNLRRLSSRSDAETEALGSRLALEVCGGDVVLLDADLAAGKTTFIRGMVAGLGGDHRVVSSPTFVLIQSYPCGRGEITTLHHVDLYRLGERLTDLREIGIEDTLSDPAAVTAVEWPKSTLAAWIPADARVWRVGITVEDDDTRSITITPPDNDDF
jgi:tRNA threonylcarbamoyladenosine biosynthesis protein TsaE